MLVLEGISSRVVTYCLAFKSLRHVTQEEDDDDDPKPLLEYEADWDPKTETGREKCLQWDKDYIIPALRHQFTFKAATSEHEATGVRDAQECCAEQDRHGVGTNAHADHSVSRTS